MDSPALELMVPQQQLSLFFPLLRQGVSVVTCSGQTVHAFLHQDLGLSEKVIQSRVQTVFLNGQPADELDKAPLAQGDVLTLSAAMPGLLGACMRVDSPYAAMRGSCSQDQAEKQFSRTESETITFTLKLFNFMATEVGPLVCRRGIFLPLEKILDLLQRSADQGLLPDRIGLTLDGKPLNPTQDTGKSWLRKAHTVLLRTRLSE